MFKLLLDTGRIDVEVEDQYGRAPLSWAAQNRRQAVVKMTQPHATLLR